MPVQFGARRLSVEIAGLAAGAIRELTIRTAHEMLAEEVAKGFDPDPRRVVDGRFDARIEDVKPYGKITLSERVPLADAALWVLEQMRGRARAFRKTGDYEGAMTIFVERTPVEPTAGAINAVLSKQPNAAVRVAPIIVYARRLEKKYRVVDATYRLANNRFGRSMFVVKETIYAGQIGSAESVTRRFTGGKRLATPMKVEQTFPGIRLYRAGSVGSYQAPSAGRGVIGPAN